VTFLWLTIPTTAQTEQAPVIRVLIFYSPNCPHCFDVFNKIIDPIRPQYKGEVEFITVDVTGRSGRDQYRSIIDQFKVSPDRQAIPMIVVGEHALVGDLEISQELPRLIEAGLRGEDLGAVSISGGSVSEGVATHQKTPTLQDYPFPFGWLVLFTLVSSTIYCAMQLFNGRAGLLQPKPRSNYSLRTWIFLGLCGVGFIISLYMSYLDILGLNPNCAEMNACSMFREIDYTKFAGIPIATFGIGIYSMIGALWIFPKQGSLRISQFSSSLLQVLLLAAAIFSIILTIIELMVLETTCVLCLSSGMAIALLCLLGATPDHNFKKQVIA
jgi:uncharacterized membrane protein/glutaredoxin